MNNENNDGAMTEEYLYSPVRFYLHNPREEEENGEYGEFDLYDKKYEISGDDAYAHSDAVELAILRDRDRMDKTHGMAEYLPTELKAKVWSMFPSIEFQGGGYYCVTRLELTSPLTPAETAELKDWWSGQLSDGWGESLEQREIKIGDEELYIVPWNSDRDAFFINTQAEFDWRMGNPPPKLPRSGGYTSVLDRISKAKEEQRANPPGKDITNTKRREECL